MTVLEAEREAYWEAVVSGDEASAVSVATTCAARGAALEDLFDLVRFSQDRVGELWASNQLSVPQEHAATTVSETVLAALGGRIATEGGPRVLVSCAEREWHQLPAALVTHTLRAAGLDARFLGPSTSVPVLVSEILDVGPRAVLLSASLVSSLPRVQRQIEAVRGTNTPVIVGGRAFGGEPQRALRLGATAYADSPIEAIEILRTLPLQVTPVAPRRDPAFQEARAIAARADELMQSILASELMQAELGSSSGSPDHWTTVLATFVPHLIDTLVGALTVADPEMLARETTWLLQVITVRGGRPEAVAAFWRVLADQCSEYPVATSYLEARTSTSTSSA